MALYGSFEQDKCGQAAARLRWYRRRLGQFVGRLRCGQTGTTPLETTLVENDRALAAVCHDRGAPVFGLPGRTGSGGQRV
jgi:hypothetical protein